MLFAALQLDQPVTKQLNLIWEHVPPDYQDRLELFFPSVFGNDLKASQMEEDEPLKSCGDVGDGTDCKGSVLWS